MPLLEEMSLASASVPDSCYKLLERKLWLTDSGSLKAFLRPRLRKESFRFVSFRFQRETETKRKIYLETKKARDHLN